MNILMLMMGGKGERFGADIPKQYTIVEGKPIFAYIIEKYCLVKEIDSIVLISHKDWIDFVSQWLNKIHVSRPYHVVPGGPTRSESVLNGLQKVKQISFKEDDIVLIHDATHPYVDITGTYEIIQAAKSFGGATLGGCQYDTMYLTDHDNMISKVIPRENIVSGASPEAFLLKKIYQIYDSSTEEELKQMTSAGAIALSHGIQMKVIPSNILNLKITYPSDLELFKRLAKNYFFDDNEERCYNSSFRAL